MQMSKTTELGNDIRGLTFQVQAPGADGKYRRAMQSDMILCNIFQERVENGANDFVGNKKIKYSVFEKIVKNEASQWNKYEKYFEPLRKKARDKVAPAAASSLIDLGADLRAVATTGRRKRVPKRRFSVRIFLCPDPFCTPPVVPCS